MGAPARLGRLPGAERFLRHLPTAAARLALAIERCGERLPALARLAARAAAGDDLKSRTAGD